MQQPIQFPIPIGAAHLGSSAIPPLHGGFAAKFSDSLVRILLPNPGVKA